VLKSTFAVSLALSNNPTVYTQQHPQAPLFGPDYQYTECLVQCPTNGLKAVVFCPIL